jgi:hypothetical protein
MVVKAQDNISRMALPTLDVYKACGAARTNAGHSEYGR